MSLTCPQCDAENRDSAKFCVKCAHQLVLLSEPTQLLDIEAPARRRRRAGRGKARASRPPVTRIAAAILVSLAALLVLGSMGWLWGPPAVTPAASQAAQATDTTPAGVAKQRLDGAAPIEAPAPAPESEAVARAVDAVQALSAGSTVPDASADADVEPAAAATAALQPTPARPTATRDRKARAPQPPAAAAARAEARPQAEITASATAIAPAPAAPATLCEDSRFFAHAVCLQNECSKPAMQQHPQCLRLHELQDSLRKPSQGG